MANARSRVRSTRLRGYEARLAQLSEAFKLPDGMDEFVTVSLRGNDLDVKVGATAGATTTSVDVEATGALRDALKTILGQNRDRLHLMLKRDLAVNMLAGMTAPVNPDE